MKKILNKGFTLIELIVVIGVLAVLTVIASIGVGRYIVNSKISAANVNIITVIDNIRAIYAQNGELPDEATTVMPVGITYTAGNESKYTLILKVKDYNLDNDEANEENFSEVKDAAIAYIVGAGKVKYALDAAK